MGSDSDPATQIPGPKRIPGRCSRRRAGETPARCSAASLTAGAQVRDRERSRSESACPSRRPVAPPPPRLAEPEEAEQALSRLLSGLAAEEVVRRAREAEVRAGRRERLAGGSGSVGRAAPRAGRSRREESAPCVRAEAGPCEPQT